MPAERRSEPSGEIALVLSGGGARAAYQVGVLRALARRMPSLRFRVITGVSAGAINAAFLASSTQGLKDAVEELARLWSRLRTRDVFRVDPAFLARNLVRWGARLVSGGASGAPRVRALLEPSPLGDLLARALGDGTGRIDGIERNLAAGTLRAVALTTIDYSTGQTVSWVEGRGIAPWQRPGRRSAFTRLTTAHVMASAALPLVFPAVELDGTWHGDGGVRLADPLSPAVHLGASRILAISTLCTRACVVPGPRPAAYPPPAQIAGLLTDAVFLDLLDEDALRLRRLNEIAGRLPLEERGDVRPIDLVVLRPSQDLGRLAGSHETDLPRGLRFLLRGLGSRESPSADFLSLLMFEPRYLTRLVEIGEADAETYMGEIGALLAPAAAPGRSPGPGPVPGAGSVVILDGPERRAS